MSSLTIKNRINDLSAKERVGIILAVSVVLYAIWDFTFMQPMAEKQALLNSELDEKNQKVMTLSQQVQDLIDSDQSPLYIKNRQRLESIISQLEQTDQKLLAITSSLIAPDQMAKVLETVLTQSEGLTIRRLDGLGAKPFPERIEKPELEKNKASLTEQKKTEVIEEQLAWRHGLQVEFSGSYLDTLEYLQSLEELHWKFYWDSVELNIDEYPNVNTVIKVYTLSLDEEWIDV